MTVPSAFQRGSGQARPVRNVVWNFDQEVVLITGAARGQGRSHALEFARAGARLALCDLCGPLDTVRYALSTEEDLEGVARECRALGSDVFTRVCDVRDYEGMRRVVDEVVGHFGRLDVAVANAGIATVVEVVEMGEDVWDEMLDTNLKGVFNLFRHAAEPMIARGAGGSLIATASVNAYVGYPANAHYTAAKHGIAGFCKGLALELASARVRVNYVCPTAVDTAMCECLNDDRAPEGYGENLVKLTGPFNLLDQEGSPLDPAEVSQAVLWLASDAARYVTGQAVVVDAGFLAK